MIRISLSTTWTFIALLCSLLHTGKGLAQKYDFVNYGIEEGLVQSQVNKIVQDQYGMLWISTLGGISRFDGKEFSNFNYGNGLVHSLTSTVFVDRTNTIWIGSEAGLQSYNGRNFKIHEIVTRSKRRTIREIQQTADGSLFALMNGWRLFKLNAGTTALESVTDTTQIITTITTDSSELYAAFFKKGIFRWSGGQWLPVFKLVGRDTNIVFRQLSWSASRQGLYGLGEDGLFFISEGRMDPVEVNFPSSPMCMEIDHQGTIYVGTIRGAYKILPNQKPEFIGQLQGLSDNGIMDIFRDREDNLWFASDGNGIFKFHDQTFRIYDRGSGLSGNIIMALAKDTAETIWAGSLENGLSVIDRGKITHHLLPTGTIQGNKINCLFIDRAQDVWIGTLGEGLWRYKNKKFERIGKDIPRFPRSYTSIYQDSKNTIWLTSPAGLAKIENGTPMLVPGLNVACFSVIEYLPDSMIIGTSNGMYGINRKLQYSPFELPGTAGLLISSMRKWGKYIVLGTSENGIVLWDPSNGKTFGCNEKNGLSSNMTFSILPVGDVLYVSTVNGLNKITFNESTSAFNVRPLKSANQKLGPECNQNALLQDYSGRIWVGTTKGIYIYEPRPFQELDPPRLYLKSVQVSSQALDSAFGPDTLIAWASIPKSLFLNHRQNHLTFSLLGIHLSAPEKMKYQYFLSGTDTLYSIPNPVPWAIYPNLPPGKYTFKARAVLDTDPPVYSNELTYDFRINPPFYQTNWFRLIGILTLLLAGAVIQKIRMVIRTRHQALLKETRLQEQIKIQQRTSEDLHDDLGNKITRLSLLTDILQTKLEGNVEQNKLMSQIRDNIQGLYVGTKDIIWALAPNNNTLYEVVNRIYNFGMELFQDTQVHFRYIDTDPEFKEVKPPFEYSRNIIMVTKEAFNNILKHANASQASIEFDLTPSSLHDGWNLTIWIKDNGQGIPEQMSLKKGYGLDNMQKRISRIGGHLHISPNLPQGTAIQIKIKIPRSEGE
jgi:ligand-binding sensor domain-containing protein/signal transduction histidine kinase